MREWDEDEDEGVSGGSTAGSKLEVVASWIGFLLLLYLSFIGERREKTSRGLRDWWFEKWRVKKMVEAKQKWKQISFLEDQGFRFRPLLGPTPHCHSLCSCRPYMMPDLLTYCFSILFLMKSWLFLYWGHWWHPNCANYWRITTLWLTTLGLRSRHPYNFTYFGSFLLLPRSTSSVNQLHSVFTDIIRCLSVTL